MAGKQLGLDLGHTGWVVPLDCKVAVLLGPNQHDCCSLLDPHSISRSDQLARQQVAAGTASWETSVGSLALVVSWNLKETTLQMQPLDRTDAAVGSQPSRNPRKSSARFETPD